jgi:Cu+-exporting ATPase
MSAVEAAAAERTHVLLPIERMTCATCAGRVEKALRSLPGVEATVNLTAKQADVHFDPARLAPSELGRAIARADYDVPHETRELAISGMTCATCAGRVEKALSVVQGVTWADVNLASEKASVEGIAGILMPADLIAAVQRAGYDADRRCQVKQP